MTEYLKPLKNVKPLKEVIFMYTLRAYQTFELSITKTSLALGTSKQQVRKIIKMARLRGYTVPDAPRTKVQKTGLTGVSWPGKVESEN